MNGRGCWTLFAKELLRFRRVALQTVAAPAITALLYLLVFAQALAGRVEVRPGVSYQAFLIPGLIMMAILQNAFANSSSSLIQSKVTGNLVFILLAPLSALELLAAFVAGAVVRGLAVGAAVWLVALPFVTLPVHSAAHLVAFAVFGGAVLGALGVVAALWADKFDEMAAFQSFVVTPLSFLAGVFYSIAALPPFWQRASRLNPFFYLVDGFRYGFFGHSDVPPSTSLAVLAASLLLVTLAALGLLARGYKIRS